MSLNWLWSEKCGEAVKNVNTIKRMASGLKKMSSLICIKEMQC